jgi:hypothetical protein
MAQQLLNNALSSSSSSQGSSAPAQVGGSALAGADIAEVDAGLKSAVAGGAVAGAVAGAEAYSSLKGLPLVGGAKKGRSGRSRKSKSQSQSQSQTGGMVPGLLSAVETALVPLGLYLGQKALQSRRSGSRSLGRFVDIRSASRRTRRRR